jgi:hypothetical protein
MVGRAGHRRGPCRTALCYVDMGRKRDISAGMNDLLEFQAPQGIANVGGWSPDSDCADFGIQTCPPRSHPSPVCFS